jgi:uncharacterized membrane protein YgcG
MTRTTPTALTALLVVLGATAVAPGQPPGGAGATGVRDGAKIFAPAMTTEADKVLRDVEKESRWQTRIETVDSLGGKSPRDYAADAAKKAGVHGLYVLIAPAEKKIQVEPSDSARSRFNPAVRQRLIASFVDATKPADQRATRLASGKKEADEARADGFNIGLRRVVAEVRRVALGYGVLDHAKLFDTVSTGLVNNALNSIRTRRQVVVETVDSLGGKPINEVAAANARALGVRGVYLLIAKNDHKVFVEPSDSARKDFPAARTKAVVDAVVNAFKANDDPDRYNKGLRESVVLLGKDLGVTAAALSDKTFVETFDDAPGNDLLALAKADVAAAKTKPQEKAPETTAHAQPLVPAAPPSPPASGPAPRPVPPSSSAASSEPARPAAGGGSIAPVLIGGLGVVIVLWLLSRVFRRSAAPAQPPRPGYAPGPGPAPGPGYGAGYGQPGQGPGPGPRPGYGPGLGPAPAPGYGYGPPQPAAGGGAGGFVSGALGGIGGAIVGNMIYDKFGRPQQAPPGMEPPHVHGAGAFPPESGPLPRQDPNATAAFPPTPAPETYDPNAGAGGDWGAPDPNPVQDPDAPDDAVEGDWSSDAPAPAPDPVEEPTGDWTPADQAEDAASGDWGAPAPAEEPTGDWTNDAPADESADPGYDDGSSGTGDVDENQGGSW